MGLADGTAWEEEYGHTLKIKKPEVYTFMIKVTLKNSKLSGSQWVNNKESHLNSYVEVKAETLKDAVDKVKMCYNDRDKYWVKSEDSYMVLEYGHMV